MVEAKARKIMDSILTFVKSLETPKTVSREWETLGLHYDLSRLKEQGVNPDRILSPESLFLTGGLLDEYRQIIAERDHIAFITYGCIDDHTRRQAEQVLAPKIEALEKVVALKEARRLSQQYGYSNQEALELAEKNTWRIGLRPSYVAVRPDQDIVADVYLDNDALEPVQTKLVGVHKPSFVHPKFIDGKVCIVACLEIVHDPSDYREPGSIITINLEPYWLRKSQHQL